jgi:hypothetical protein
MNMFVSKATVATPSKTVDVAPAGVGFYIVPTAMTVCFYSTNAIVRFYGDASFTPRAARRAARRAAVTRNKIN